jgi:hypothetical protein
MDGDGVDGYGDDGDGDAPGDARLPKPGLSEVPPWER